MFLEEQKLPENILCVINKCTIIVILEAKRKNCYEMQADNLPIIFLKMKMRIPTLLFKDNGKAFSFSELFPNNRINQKHLPKVSSLKAWKQIIFI